MPLSLLQGVPQPVATLTLSNNAGFTGGYSSALGIAQCYAPVAFGGAIYVCWQAVGDGTQFTPQGGIFVSQSTDNGNSWTILDQAHSPTRTAAFLEPDGGIFFDGAHTITVCYSVTADPVTPVIGPMQFQDFDLSTGLWSAVYGTVGAPNCYFIQALYIRPAGDRVILYTDTLNGVKAVTYVAGFWGAPFAVDAHFSGAGTIVAESSSAMDSTGAIHVFGFANTSPGQFLWYQQITSGNTLGTFATLQSVSSGNLNGSGISRQCAVGGNYIAIGSMTTPGNSGDPTIIYGTPLSAPVFTMSGPIDPAAPIGNPQTSNAALAFSGGIWYAVYFTNDVTNAWTIRALAGSATPAGPWLPAVTATQGPSGPYRPSQLGIGVFNSTLGVLAGFTPVSTGFDQPQQSMVSYAISGAGAVSNPIINPYSIHALPLPDPRKCR